MGSDEALGVAYHVSTVLLDRLINFHSCSWVLEYSLSGTRVGRHVASSNAGQVGQAPWPDSPDTVDYVDRLVSL